ncbi:PREDICTED: uncharacterized protein LOC108364137, partial [Rhagoletis zephyria]|uniref:uncharacterized protein LOC108364137 n=1 Tax=Rhagoletis zephyria TaxID=28612 RepID=UPI0008112ACC
MNSWNWNHLTFPTSFMKQSCVPNNLVTLNNPQHNYRSIGGLKLNILCEIQCFVKFKNEIKNVKINILPDNEMLVPVIFGRDFLKLFNIRLTKIKNRYAKSDLVSYRNGIPCTPLPDDLVEILN